MNKLSKSFGHLLSISVLVLVAISNVGGCNVFGEMSDKNSDAAIIEDVRKYIDIQQWSDAIAKWQLLSPTGQTKRENKVLLASAYAGWGGLNTVDLFISLGNMGSNTLFTTLLSAFTGSTVADYNYEVTAESIMQTISVNASSRTTDENMFLLFIEFAKLGTLMAATGDLDGNGVVDATYENCTMISSAQGDHVATAIGNIADILAVTGSTLGGIDLSGFCTPFPAICAMKQTSDVDAASNQVARTLIGESNLGFGLAAPLNDNYCQLSLAPIDPTGAPGFSTCPAGIGVASIICP